ncbi:GSCOCG00007809001-RA-CDS, partial [Cotesia congregata]
IFRGINEESILPKKFSFWKMLVIVIVSVLIAGSSTVTVQPGPCPNFDGASIDFNRMAGKWYEYANTYDQYNGTLGCTNSDVFTLENNIATLFTTSISKSTGNILAFESEVSKRLPGNELNIVTHIPLIGNHVLHYWALEVIPHSYGIYLFCRNQGSNHVQSIDIYTRNPTSSVDIIGRARQLALKRGLSVP